MFSSIGEGLPSDAGGPRFDPQCPLLHQIHAIYEAYCDMYLTFGGSALRIKPNSS